jgi:hypothetical protein
MFRGLLFILAVLISTTAVAQTPPPGAPYDASKHPNPIITFVEDKDFKPVSYEDAKRTAGIELLGLGQDEAKQESIEVADGKFVKNMQILNFRTDVTFYAVVRQKFKLSNGPELVLYSFRFPKVALPPQYARMVLNEAAVEKKKKPSEMRFGGSAPEELEIRGARGLLWAKDGVNTVYWQEDGIGHVVAGTQKQDELFEVIEDLL